MKTGFVHRLSGHTNWLSDCAIDQAGKIALSASLDNTLRVWDIDSGTCLHILEGHNRITCCALSPDGSRALAGSDDTTLRLWDTQIGRCTSLLKGHSGKIQNCVFNSDGQRALSVGSDNTLCLWNIVDGTLLYKLRSSNIDLSFPTPCALSPDSRRALYVSNKRTLHLVEIETEQEIAAFTFDASINFIALSPEGDNIMVGDGSGRVHFLSIENAGG